MSRPLRSKEMPKTEAQEFIEIQNHCALCNTKLEIKVESYLEDFFIKEEAVCPHCKIKTREKNHRMH
jgi:hypothetical protein